MKVKIMSADPAAWSASHIGEIFDVLNRKAPIGFDYVVNCQNYEGECCLKAEHCTIVNEFQGLETAYDEVNHYQIGDKVRYYKYPETKGIVMKKSVPQLVSDSFNQLSGKNITAAEVESIITLHEVMKKMEK